MDILKMCNAKKIITVLTPVYNRKNELGNLYNSLLNQDCYEFIWLVVDDGSRDDIKSVVEQWKNEAPFSVCYLRQENGGKHRALNNGILHIDTELTFIVDSDDVLTKDAITTVLEDAPRILQDYSLCGIGYLRGYSPEQVIGDQYPTDGEINDFISVRFNQNIGGDKAEVWKTNDLKTVPFPEFEGEKFMSEGYVWCKLALKKRMVFRNKIIYITEYLDGGLSKSGRSLRVKCPLGGMASSQVMMDKSFNFKNRLKGALLYVAYGRFANKPFSEMLNGTNEWVLVMLAYIPGTILYYRWKRYL